MSHFLICFLGLITFTVRCGFLNVTPTPLIVSCGSFSRLLPLHHIHIHTHTHLSATHSHMNMHTHECIQPHIHARMYACTRITMCHSSLCYSWNQRPDRNSFILAQPVMARWGRQSRGAHAIASRKWRKPLHPLYPFPSLILPGSSACGTMAPKFPFLINLLWKHPHIHPHRRTSLIS